MRKNSRRKTSMKIPEDKRKILTIALFVMLFVVVVYSVALLVKERTVQRLLLIAGFVIQGIDVVFVLVYGMSKKD